MKSPSRGLLLLVAVFAGGGVSSLRLRAEARLPTDGDADVENGEASQKVVARGSCRNNCLSKVFKEVNSMSPAERRHFFLETGYKSMKWAFIACASWLVSLGCLGTPVGGLLILGTEFVLLVLCALFSFLTSAAWLESRRLADSPLLQTGAGREVAQNDEARSCSMSTMICVIIGLFALDVGIPTGAMFTKGDVDAKCVYSVIAWVGLQALKCVSFLVCPDAAEELTIQSATYNGARTKRVNPEGAMAQTIQRMTGLASERSEARRAAQERRIIASLRITRADSDVQAFLRVA